MPSAQLCRHKLTVDDYYKIAEAGVIKEQDRVELIEGEIIDRVPIGNRHAFTIDKIAEEIYQHKASDILVRIQNPVRLNDYMNPSLISALSREKTIQPITPNQQIYC
jgi:hypothetical protein